MKLNGVQKGKNLFGNCKIFYKILSFYSFCKVYLSQMIEVLHNAAWWSCEKFQKIAAYLDMNFCEDISLKKIAAEFGISESKLKTGFKKVFSRTIFDYIRALRFKYAEKLIREKELSILEIAYEIGYSNPSHFSQAFKERYGELPKAYQLRYS